MLARTRISSNEAAYCFRETPHPSHRSVHGSRGVGAPQGTYLRRLELLPGDRPRLLSRSLLAVALTGSATTSRKMVSLGETRAPTDRIRGQSSAIPAAGIWNIGGRTLVGCRDRYDIGFQRRTRGGQRPYRFERAALDDLRQGVFCAARPESCATRSHFSIALQPNQRKFG